MTTTDFNTAQMWARNTVGDATWESHISTVDEEALCYLVASLNSQQQLFNRRQQYVKMLLDLGPKHECDCDRRWTSADAAHQESCDLLKACTCERRWVGKGLHVRDHSPQCRMRQP